MGVCCSNRRKHRPLQATLNQEVESDSDNQTQNQTQTTSPIDDDNTVILDMENDLTTPSQPSANTTTPNGYTLTPSNSSINSSPSRSTSSSFSKYLKSFKKSTSKTAGNLKKKASKRVKQYKMLHSTDTFPQMLLTEWIIKEGVVLNDILDEIYNNETTSFFIPEEITQTIVLYTIDLLPGVYEFRGRMNYGGSISLSNGNYCSCQIILNSRCEIVGGYFRENSFKYHITNGSYTLDVPHCFEFTKEYFNYNYKYKVYGQLFDIKKEPDTDNDDEEEDDDPDDMQLQFRGKWRMQNGARGGNIIMKCINGKKKKKGKGRGRRVNGGDYVFYGYCDYLPNVFKNKRQKKIELEFFDRRQKVECKLRLEKGFAINGYIRLLVKEYGDNDDDEGEKYKVEGEGVSEWDEYGGLHIVYENGYKMDGFFNGRDFMGVWKDEQDVRFGHFQFGKIGYSKLSDDEDDETEEDDEEEEEEKEEELPTISSRFLLQRAKSLESDED